MLRRISLTTLASILILTGIAEAKTAREKYVGIRVEAKKQLDKGQVGPDLRHTGVRSPSGKMVRAKARHFASGYRELRTRVDPPPVPTYRGGGMPPPYIAECESGGSYTAVNPSSGAYGKWQIMPFHWTSGICRDLDRSPAGQDACAARIWKTSGPGAWVCA